MAEGLACYGESAPVPVCRHAAEGKPEWVRWLRERAGQIPVASKPRVPLGVPHCIPCLERKPPA